MKRPLLLSQLSLRLPRKSGIPGNVSELTWSDGTITAITSFNLRMRCPCASCRETGGPRGVPPTVEITAQNPVGNYAVNFVFSDGHNTGIYTYHFLRELDESGNEI